MILRSDKNTLEAKTDANGYYAFFGVPAGKYRVEANLPQHFEIAQTILSEPVPPIDLPQNACYEYNVEVLPTGRIRGKVIGPDGNALPYASVELYRPSRYWGDGRSLGWSADSQRIVGAFPTDNGWEIRDGPMPGFGAQGKSGNEKPNHNEQMGRSSGGRQGMSDGEMAGDTASNLANLQVIDLFVAIVELAFRPTDISPYILAHQRRTRKPMSRRKKPSGQSIASIAE